MITYKCLGLKVYRAVTGGGWVVEGVPYTGNKGTCVHLYLQEHCKFVKGKWVKGGAA